MDILMKKREGKVTEKKTLNSEFMNSLYELPLCNILFYKSNHNFQIKCLCPFVFFRYPMITVT